MNSKTIPVALSLGGNLGNVVQTFSRAAEELHRAGMTGIIMSSSFRNPAEGCAPGTPDFVNGVLCGNWPGNVEELHAICKRLEVEAGRPADHLPYCSRTLDIDIILFGNAIIATQSLQIPHREALNRLFVLVPLAEIAGNWPFPGQNETIEQIVAGKRASAEYIRFMTGKIN